eukprot:TRINITY_DN87614_c0_g1_i1.p1 TRINITY_DN87614_c0_g1~~TRINITY_DN87614_c0_g1_i1.p1  ORF type:complete len:166 (+),score=37.01 TRINITY_DN87614_c0_g1_i1:120-617(+)
MSGYDSGGYTPQMNQQQVIQRQQSAGKAETTSMQRQSSRGSRDGGGRSGSATRRVMAGDGRRKWLMRVPSREFRTNGGLSVSAQMALEKKEVAEFAAAGDDGAVLNDTEAAGLGRKTSSGEGPQRQASKDSQGRQRRPSLRRSLSAERRLKRPTSRDSASRTVAI